MKNNSKSGFLYFYIDTGGTFTDCLATDAGGNEFRCKVLSSGAIRGVAEKCSQPDRVKIQIDFDVKNNFFSGYDFCFFQHPDNLYQVKEYDPDHQILFFDEKISFPEDEQFPFELKSPEEAPILASRIITNTALNDNLPPLSMRLSTTKGTNALLERSGGSVLFLITEGFKDLLQIRNQQRPDLFSLDIHQTRPFYRHIVEVPERIDAAGKILKPLDIELLEKRIKPFLTDTDAGGICLMNSYQNSDHERQIEKLLHELGVNNVSRSTVMSPEIKIVPRAVTTDVNSYLSPVMNRYLDQIRKVIQSDSLRIMTSGGSLAEASHFQPKDGLLSGPAGGLIGAAAISKKTGHQKIISFDMGGTSTDVARYDGDIDYIYEHSVGNATLTAPAVSIETVAAGGGSICGFDGQSLTVGPESAGADPGPACYGRGGPLTITDVNLLSGRLNPANFHISILPEASEQKLTALMEKINNNCKNTLSREQVLEGLRDIANERMALAIRKISIQKGFDPAEYALIAFGGAGAQHAAAIASKLNISTILIPSDAGLLSAYGLQEAKPEEIATRQVLKPLNKIENQLPVWFDELAESTIKKLKCQGLSRQNIRIKSKKLHLRLTGQDSSIEIEWEDSKDIKEAFKKAYTGQYGHWIKNRAIELEAIRTITAGKIPSRVKPKKELLQAADFSRDSHSASVDDEVSLLFNNTRNSAPLYNRSDFRAGDTLKGPAVILDPYSTTVIEPGWAGTLLDDGTWMIKEIPFNRQKNQQSEAAEKSRNEAVNLQLYTNRFRSVADQMGEMLRKTALSVNVKERHDFSCALLDRDGYLVVNAPHIPVHLGAMGTCVRSVMDSLKRKTLEEGDVIVTNHPGFGGSHLPDLTVITPVFFEGERIGFAANRAHHAEMGGKRPGSMPPDAANLSEEGVVIPPTFIARAGNFDWEPVKDLLQNSRWPSRSPEENMADLQAAVAANHRGLKELKKLASSYGAKEVTRYMQKLKEYAAKRMQSTLRQIPDGNYAAEEKLDDGSLLKVHCKIVNYSLTIDFTGTSDVHPGNLNANPSIVNSVIMYVLRLMVDEPLPLNDGLLTPVEINIPIGMLNPHFPDNPQSCPAVVGGNIETSQRLADTLLKAFKLSACSYGTMNNVLFGNESFGYYETVAGGTGAGDGFHGAHAVHQHMTNTRATDPEILEYRYPVRLDRYVIRKNSGGRGKWCGGDGIIREITFLEPVSLSVLSQHRVVPPFGLNNGQPGKTGEHWIERKEGSIKELKWKDGAELKTGDRFILHTPGGGGWGGKD